MKEISLYIHIPFCKQKCLYCDFPSYGGKDTLIPSYIEALKNEIKTLKDKYIIRSIFIGGGTPSHLPPIAMRELLKEIKNLRFHENIEYTMECNPGSLTEEKLRVMKENGVNRISMGLQSSDDSLLMGIGRIHSFNEFKENYKLARAIGFNNINVDLMFGLPNQTVEQWKNTLKDIIELSPEHISAYSLIVEEGTPFYRMWEKDLLNLPSEDEEREMYEITKGTLLNGGYNQYEISNYSKENKECYHNTVYWQFKEYIGVGVSSSSFYEGKRIKNIDSIENYIQNISKAETIKEEVIENSLDDNLEEFMFMGLRMMVGVSEKRFEELFKVKIDDVYKKEIEKNIKLGLLIRESGHIFLSEKGVEVSNCVMSDFVK